MSNLASKLGEIASKWNKSGTFSDQSLVHFGSVIQNILKSKQLCMYILISVLMQTLRSNYKITQEYVQVCMSYHILLTAHHFDKLAFA